jgi:hypothetical protein
MLGLSAVMLVLTGVLGTVFAQNSPDLLVEGFKTPPDSAIDNRACRQID